jgi:hypothetical protein
MVRALDRFWILYALQISFKAKISQSTHEWLIDPKDLDAVKERKVGRPLKGAKR